MLVQNEEEGKKMQIWFMVPSGVPFSVPVSLE